VVSAPRDYSKTKSYSKACGCAVVSWLLRIERSSFEPRGPFLEGPEKVLPLQSRSKISKFMTAELCYSPILSRNRGSIPYKKSLAYTPVCLQIPIN